MATAEFTAGGIGVLEHVRTGVGVSVFTAVGTDVTERNKTGVGIAGMVGAGPLIGDEWIKTGAGVAGASAAGIWNRGRIKTGTAVVGFTAIGADEHWPARTGSGVTGWIASGTTAENVISKRGTATAGMAARGLRSSGMDRTMAEALVAFQNRLGIPLMPAIR